MVSPTSKHKQKSKYYVTHAQQQQQTAPKEIVGAAGGTRQAEVAAAAGPMQAHQPACDAMHAQHAVGQHSAGACKQAYAACSHDTGVVRAVASINSA